MTRVMSTYRSVLGIPSAFAMSASGLVARLPISMVGLGVVVLVSTETGSYSLAGSISATYIAASAVFGILQARLMDRFGQRIVLLLSMTLSMSGLAMTMVAVEAGWATPAPHLFAAVCGGAMPLVGSAVRSRWSHLVEDKRLLQTAFALEAVADEVVFLVGPVLVTVLATALHPLAGLVTAIVAAVTGTLVFASLRSTEPPMAPRKADATQREALGWAVIGPLAVSAACMGFLFGAAEVVTVAFSEEHGRKELAGLMLASWSLGSLLSGLVVGTIRWQASNQVRFRRALLVLGLLLLPLPLVGSFPVLGVALFLAGWAISPSLIAAISWVEEAAPSSRLTEGMAAFSTGLTAGLAPGAAAAGWMVDHHGVSASYWLPAGAALLGVAIAWVAGRARGSVAAVETDREAVDVEAVRERLPGAQ